MASARALSCTAKSCAKMATPNATALHRRDLPRRFSGISRDRAGGVKGQMIGAGRPALGAAVEREMAGGGSERECREDRFS